MRKEELAEVLGDINEKHIAEARAERGTKKPALVKWAAMAACLCLVVVGVWQMNADDSPNTATGGGADSVMPGGILIGTEDLGDKGGEFYREGVKVPLPEGTVESGEQDTELGDVLGTAADAPVQNETKLEDGEDEWNDLWGGSYLDANGSYVIWLTENTVENQKKVFERNPDLAKDSTVFKTADFSLAYLTEILKNISEGMQDGKLPYVIGAGVMEQINRVSVTMTRDDERATAVVSSFDTRGGAIEFHYASGNSTEDIAAVS